MPGRDVGDGVDRNDPSGELMTGDAVAVLVLKDGSGELVATGTASIGSSLSAGRDRRSRRTRQAATPNAATAMTARAARATTGTGAVAGGGSHGMGAEGAGAGGSTSSRSLWC